MLLVFWWTPWAIGSETPAIETEEGRDENEVEATDAEGVLDTDEEVEEAPAPPRWSPLPGHPAPDTAHYDLEEVYAEGRYAEGLVLAEQRLAAHPDDVTLHWHVARFLFEVGETFDRHDPSIDKVAHYTKMVEVVERGLALAPDDPHLRFAHGVANGRLGTTRGVLASLFLAKSVEADWLHTVESGLVYSSLDGNERIPCDTYLALGIFYRLVPDLWIVQVLAGTRGSLDKSLEYQQRSVQCAPGRIGGQKELAVSQLCLGTKRKDEELVRAGKQSVRDYLKIPAVNETDRIDLRHGKLLLDDPDMACGYSRDGQQDLDEKKLKR